MLPTMNTSLFEKSKMEIMDSVGHSWQEERQSTMPSHGLWMPSTCPKEDPNGNEERRRKKTRRCVLQLRCISLSFAIIENTSMTIAFLLVTQFFIEYFCQRDVSWFKERVFFEVEGIVVKKTISTFQK